MDIASRSGLANSESITPYNGVRDTTIMNYIKADDLCTILRLLEDADDYNADKKHPLGNQIEYNADNDALAKMQVDGYERRLDYIHSSWVLKWLENQLYSVRFRNKGSTLMLNRKNKTTRSMLDNEGEFISESDLAVRDYSYRSSDSCRIKDKLIESILKLYKYGGDIGVSLFSFAIAGEKIKVFGAKPLRSKYKDRDVYEQDSLGHIGGRLINSNTDKFIDAYNLATLNRTAPATYVSAFRDFLWCLNELNIKAIKCDPLYFDQELYTRLKAYYMKINNVDITKIIAELNFETVKEENSISKNIILKRNQFKSFMLPSYTTDEEIWCRKFVSKERIFRHIFYNAPLAAKSFDSSYKFSEGYLVGSMGLVKFKVNEICFSSDCADKFALLHRTGYLILIDDNDSCLYVQKIEEAIKQYDVLLRGDSPSNYHWGNNVQFGVWENVRS